MLLILFDFLTSLGIVLGVCIRNWPNFHFWAVWKRSKLSKMPKITKIMFFRAFRYGLCLPRAMLLILFDFLTSLGIVLGVCIRNWPNFHFWAVWKRSEMSKMPKITKITFFRHFQYGLSGYQGQCN